VNALSDVCSASACALLKFIEVLHLCNIRHIGWCMHSVVCYDCFEKKLFLLDFCSSINQLIFYVNKCRSFL
jgi:hypothetical protein